MLDLAQARDRMVNTQIAGRGIRNPLLLDAMRRVPREDFISPRLKEFAYEDRPLPIGQGQTISQPYTVALMIEAAHVGPRDEVMEVGAGSGYASAVLSLIVGHVHAIERLPKLASAARQRFRALGYDNIDLHVGDGTKGWPEAAPFDAILVAAAGPEVPPALKAQLAIGGRLVMPVGLKRTGQALLKLTRRNATKYETYILAAVTFVPLIETHG